MSKAPKTILFLCADPTDETRLRLGQEIRDIENQLRSAKLRSRFKLIPKTSVRLADLSQYFLDYEPEIVHFSGHGNIKGELCFEDAHGQAKTAPKDGIADLFALSAKHVQCAVLNACFSAPQAKAILESIPSVVGMRKEIGDRAAIVFATGFYKAIGAGKSVGEAFEFAKVELKLFSIPEHATPVLFQQKPDFPPFIMGRTEIPEAILNRRYVKVWLADTGKHFSYAHIDPKAYQSLQSLLDDLYVKCLHKRFQPYTYGSSWWLTLGGGIQTQPLVPLSWLKRHKLKTSRETPGWGLAKPSEFEIRPGDALEVVTPKTRRKVYLLFATNSGRLAAILRSSPKFMYAAHQGAKSIPFEKLNSKKFKHLVIRFDWCAWHKSPPKGVFVVEETEENKAIAAHFTF